MGAQAVLQNLGYLVLTWPEHFGPTRTFSSHGLKRFSKCSGKFKYFGFVDCNIWKISENFRGAFGAVILFRASEQTDTQNLRVGQNISGFWIRKNEKFSRRLRRRYTFSSFGIKRFSQCSGRLKYFGFLDPQNRKNPKIFRGAFGVEILFRASK